MKALFKFFILYIFIFFPSFSSAENLTKDDLIDGSKVYGFYLGQEYALEQIVKKHPELRLSVEKAKIAFDLNFKPAIENIDKKFNSLSKENWNKIKIDLASKFKSYFNSNISFDSAIKFINEVENRAKGNIDKSILESLLLFNPKYNKKPELEFYDNYTYIYENDGLGKAKGVSFKLKLPITWKAKEGNRPNIVQKFTERNGRGNTVFMILIKDLPEDVSPTKEDIKEILDDKNELSSFIPDNGVLLDSGNLTLEQQLGFWIKYRIKLERGRNLEMETEGIQYIIFYQNKLISLQGQTAISVNGKETSNNGIAKYEPLFDGIVNTFVLPELYRK